MTNTHVPFRRTLSDFPHLEELAEQVGGFIEYWGFKKIHGIIWTHLYLSAVPLDATTLVKRLRVSKALVSFSIHDLLEYDVIREVARGKGRTVLYEANPDITAVILNVLRMREKQMLEDIRQAADSLSHVDPATQKGVQIDRGKIISMLEFVKGGQQALQWILESGSQPQGLFGGFQALPKV